MLEAMVEEHFIIKYDDTKYCTECTWQCVSTKIDRKTPRDSLYVCQYHTYNYNYN